MKLLRRPRRVVTVTHDYRVPSGGYWLPVLSGRYKSPERSSQSARGSFTSDDISSTRATPLSWYLLVEHFYFGQARERATTFYDEKRLPSENDPPIPDGGGRLSL